MMLKSTIEHDEDSFFTFQNQVKFKDTIIQFGERGIMLFDLFIPVRFIDNLCVTKDKIYFETNKTIFVINDILNGYDYKPVLSNYALVEAGDDFILVKNINEVNQNTLDTNSYFVYYNQQIIQLPYITFTKFVCYLNFIIFQLHKQLIFNNVKTNKSKIFNFSHPLKEIEIVDKGIPVVIVSFINNTKKYHLVGDKQIIDMNILLLKDLSKILDLLNNTNVLEGNILMGLVEYPSSVCKDTTEEKEISLSCAQNLFYSSKARDSDSQSNQNRFPLVYDINEFRNSQLQSRVDSYRFRRKHNYIPDILFASKNMAYEVIRLILKKELFYSI